MVLTPDPFGGSDDRRIEKNRDFEKSSNKNGDQKEYIQPFQEISNVDQLDCGQQREIGSGKIPSRQNGYIDNGCGSQNDSAQQNGSSRKPRNPFHLIQIWQ
jgi:hypothetical protein